MSINRWFRWLKRVPVAPLEQAILDAVRQRLSPEAQAIWTQQVAAIAHAYCNLGKEVNYYYASNFSVPQFPHTEREERRVATVHFEYANTPYKARIYLVEGHLFSIVFDRDIRSIRKQPAIRVLSVELHTDPMQASLPIPKPDAIEGSVAQLRFEGWLAEWTRRHPVHQALSALPQEVWNRLLEQRRLLHLPPDYKELLGQCDGFSGADYTVFGASDMYAAGLGADVYWVLAERGGGFVVAREGDAEAQVYFTHHEEEVPSRAFGSFQAALEYLLQRSDLP